MSYVSRDLTLYSLTTKRLRNGGIEFPPAGNMGEVLTVGENENLIWITPRNFSMIAHLSPYTEDLSAGNHIKFDSLVYSNSDDFVLDVTSPYTSTLNLPSLGRITLKGGKKYLLKGEIDAFKVKSHSSTFSIQWYDSDNSIPLGDEYTFNAIGTTGIDPDYGGPRILTVFEILTDTRVEMRIVSSNILQKINRASCEIIVI